MEEMQLYGRDKMKQSIDSKEAQHISTKGMISGILLFLFGIFTPSIIYYLFGSRLFLITFFLFTVPAVLLTIYRLLIKETRKRYAMNKARARRYILAIRTFLYGLCISIIVYLLPLIINLVAAPTFIGNWGTETIRGATLEKYSIIKIVGNDNSYDFLIRIL